MPVSAHDKENIFVKNHGCPILVKLYKMEFKRHTPLMLFSKADSPGFAKLILNGEVDVGFLFML